MTNDPVVPAAAGYPCKRLLDIGIAVLLAAPAILLVIVCGVIIWFECRANPLFIQRRVGQAEAIFKLVKLRTLAPDTADLPSHQAAHARVLTSGTVLRRLKFDEVPQIWNVLRGEMSFVGPRPCLPSQEELIVERRSRGVFRLRPGITGPAQTCGIDMSTPRKLAIADSSYLQTTSLATDLGLLAKTFFGRGRGDAIRNR